ncbi:MAG: glycosyltransferase, partial [Planctomycetota bacterium]
AMPAVSVVLPVFNGARTIARAVRSILVQSFADLELVVVDDGSTDATKAALRPFDDGRLRVVSAAHRGVVAAANEATDLATAPLIARMDADDFAHPRRIERQVRWLEEQRLDVVGCQVRIVDESGEPVPSLQRYQRWINTETLDSERIAALRFVEFPLVNPTILARREYFELRFVDDDLPEDYDLMLRAAAAGFGFGKVPATLLDWTDTAGRLTRTDQRYSTEAFMRCRRRHLLAGPLHGESHVDLWGVGQTGKPWLRWLQGCGIVVRRGYDVHPRKVNRRIHGVLIGRPEDMPVADGTPLIVAVGAEEAREMILPHLLEHGYALGGDAWFVA